MGMVPRGRDVRLTAAKSIGTLEGCARNTWITVMMSSPQEASTNSLNAGCTGAGVPDLGGRGAQAEALL